MTAVDRREKWEMLRSIGSSRTLDYREENFWELGEQYDLIFDVVGKSPFSKSIQTLKAGGQFLLANAGLSDMLRSIWVKQSTDKRVISGTTDQTIGDLAFLAELAGKGTLKVVLDPRSFTLDEIVAAHKYVESGQKLGGVVITMD